MNPKTLLIFLASISLALFAESAIAGPGGFSSSGSGSYSSYTPSSSSSSGGDEIIEIGFYIIFAFHIILSIQSYIKKSNRFSDMDDVLSHLVTLDSKYEWEKLEIVFTDIICETYKDWQALDTERLASKMTKTCFQVQNNKFLKDWQKEGFTNICSIERVNRLSPFGAHIRNQADLLNGVTVTVEMNAIIKDYLIKNDTGEVTRGSTNAEKKSVYWTFNLEDGEWKVAEIAYSQMEIRLINRLKARK
ncbi:hypothetical protein [Photobacterium galatheae]|uniref:Tim44-like domain-containing protein n=1 Tax=Photobacterium galatheae TaxID=1654360 RepID=A0A066RSM0_9GAMM|nr:hypothetical protein [Photobacterium galatheae]KDM93344.1 hypothetical protein EA58_01665 [Photobacterium galatheae]MCM0150466.1 hypothetical protein [Photobacterium galatheae]